MTDDHPHPNPSNMPAWNALGGSETMRRVVDLLVNRALADPCVNYERDGRFPQSAASVRRTKEQALAFLSSVLGGPLRYEGRPLDAIHKSMRITPPELDAFLDHFRASLTACGVAATSVAALSSALEGVRGLLVPDA